MSEGKVVVAPVGIQCPKCGVPQPVLEVVMIDHSGERGVRFECCGIVVTGAALRDAFGVDINL